VHLALLALMSSFAIARAVAGRLGPGRRGAYDHTRTIWLYTVAQGLLAIAIVQAPRFA
jgi:cytochrome c oxidase subunit I+III